MILLVIAVTVFILLLVAGLSTIYREALYEVWLEKGWGDIIRRPSKEV